MKIQRHGKASALTEEQFTLLLDNAPSPKYRMLWAAQRFCAGRISETLSLTWAQTAGGFITLFKGSTKTKATRQVPVCPQLQQEIDRYRAHWEQVHGSAPKAGEYLFHTSDSTTQPMTRQAADLAMRKTTTALGLLGVSTHSLRRTAAQIAVDKGHPLRHVMALTGHQSLGSLGEYLGATDADVLACLV